MFSTKKSNKSRNVVGDEVLATGFCKYLKKLPDIEKAELFAPNNLPDEKCDVMIYMNCSEPVKEWADKHIVYAQNSYFRQDKLEEIVQKIIASNYDGYLFYSNKLKNIFKNAGVDGLFLPFSADTELFYPVKPVKKYSYDIAYIGSDIKGRERTIEYLYPATKYKFGLYGNWRTGYSNDYILKNLLAINFSRAKRALYPPEDKDYRKYLVKYAKGNIPADDVKYLYSSSKIVLNYGIKENIEMDNISLRTYEALACGAFLISDKCPSAEREFEGKVVFSDGGKELEEQLEYYLNNPDERKAIAQKGYEYVTQYANMKTRTKELYDYLQQIVKESEIK